MKYPILFISIISILFYSNFKLENPWVLKKEEGRTKIFTRKIENSNLKEVQVKTTFKSNIDCFKKIIDDKEKFTEWIYGCSASKRLATISPLEMYHRQETDAPWPISDRDVIIHSKAYFSENNKKYFVTLTGEPDYIEKIDGFIRVPTFKGSWQLTEKTNEISITYTVMVDPGGNLPAWVVNLGAVDGPLKSLRKLKERCEACYKQ